MANNRNWWTQRWISCLESFGWSSRLRRGRTYANAGRVRQIDIQPGAVRGRVQGSRATPYRTEIEIDVLEDAEWERVLDVLAGQAYFAAKLLAGDIPQDIEKAFADAGVNMFPSRSDDVDTECSCPDWANPCKHIAALFYVLGAEFDRDPFLILRLRGRSKEEIVQALRLRRANGVQSAPAVPVVSLEDDQCPAEAALEDLLSDFWRCGADLADFQVRPVPPPVALAMLKRLGPPSFWLGGDGLANTLADVYRLATLKALDLAYSGDANSGEASLEAN